MTAGLPTYRTPAPGHPVRRTRTSLRLDDDLVHSLKALAKAHDTDLRHVLLAACLAVQPRYTGEAAAAIGMGDGTVLALTDVEDSSFTQLVAAVRDMPPQPARPENRISVVFGPLAAEGPAADAELLIDIHDIDDIGDSDSDGSAVVIEATYDAEVFDTATVDRFLAHINSLSATAVTAPHTRRLADLPVLTETEQQRVLVDWNATETPLDHAGCLHERFAARAAVDPDAPAVIQGGKATSARDIDAAANRLAHHLRGLGVDVRSRVALCVDRGPELLTAVLGVLKAGGAYVPLDADYPAERLAFMQRDSDCQVLITQSRLLGRLPAPGIPVVLLDGEADRIAAQPSECPKPTAGPDDLCYIIYTSGSTGRPKGIALRHRGVLNNLLDLNARFAVGPGDKVLALSSTSFDMSVYEFLGITLAGGTVVIADPGRAKDPAHWHELIQRHQVSVWNSAPALAELYVAHLQGLGDERTGLRLAMLGGDWVTPTLPDRLRAFAPGIRVIVMGGATESSIHSTLHEAGSPLPEWSSVPYGRPMANQRTYILDARQRPVPIGVPGELHLAGVGLAEGYLGRPELTAEKFTDFSFGPVHGERVYRTGDLARFRPDGQIELLGRIDFQTKIRGLRVELGEIEALLRAQPEIAEAVVCVATDGVGDRFLAAYVVADTDAESDAEAQQGLDTDDIRARVAHALPDYMVPAALTELDRLPVTPNGKLDRAALIRMAGAPRGRTTHGTGPADGLERALAALWRENLGVTEVFREDGFVALGGHSLKAVRLASRIRQTLDAPVTSAAVLGSRDLAELAALVRAAQAEPQAAEAQLTRGDEDEDGDGSAPLSFAQERLWYLDRLMPGSPAYNVAVTLPWHAELDTAALRRALDRLIARHEALRTTFTEAGGLVRQTVGEPWSIDLPIEDTAPDEHAPDEDAPNLETPYDDTLAARIRREAAVPFDLSAGPLLRARLIRVADGPQALVLTMHHIITDGWSLDVFFAELEQLYAAETGGGPAQLPELPVGYRDYARWQRAQQDSGAWDADLGYWRERLDGAPTVLELPSRRVRPAQQSFKGGLHPFGWDRELQERLADLGRRQGVTPHMIVLAAFTALLSRHTGETDIVVGAPAAMRTRPELEPLLGFFVNTLPLRVDLDGDPEFGEILARVREAVLGAVEHQDLPFERLVEELRPERDPARMPVVQFLVQFNDVPLRAVHLGGHRLQPRPADPGAAKVDLTLIVEDRGDGLDGSLEYNGDVLDQADAALFAEQLTLLLRQVAQAPGTRLTDLSLLAPDQRGRILDDWNRTGAALPEAPVHRLFEQHADASPDLPAVIAGNSTLTYRELEERANRLAHRLRRAGVRAGDRVGICLDRSPELVVAMVATLKAGAAYVPLDPEYPGERLALMADDAGLRVIVTRRGTVAELPGEGRLQLFLDDGREGAAESAESAKSVESAESFASAQSVARPDAFACPDSAAYVVYTSGSTGRPKGVVVDHRAIVRLVRESDYVRIRAGDRVAQAANASFDATTFEVWGALANGGCVVVLPRDVVLDPDKLAAALVEHGIASLFLTTAAVNAVAHQRPDAFHSLRELLFGGEAVDPGAVRRILEHGAPQRLLHVYGPTETTTFATWHQVLDVPADAATVPIGRPIANTRAYVLDTRMRPVPVGMPGELYLGGPGLAAGYLGRPDLTAERFVPHPYAERPGERLYRTGDTVRYRADGAIEFLGRSDGQVKIRGFRIEPGEIEAALGAHPAVARAAVVIDAPGGAAKRLAAFVEAATPVAAAPVAAAPVAATRETGALGTGAPGTGGPVTGSPGTGAPVTAEELRTWLRRTLPAYLVPSVYVLLDALPITPNGKVDRRALRVPEGHRGLPEGASATGAGPAPRTPVEEILTGIWAEVLGLEEVAVDDDFFELGGHSLLMIPLLARVNEALGTSLSMGALMSSPNPRALAAQATATAEDAGPVPRRREPGSDEPVPLSFAQQRLWFMDQLEPDSSLYNVPLLLRLHGDLDRTALERALGLLVRRHEVLRTSYPATRGRPRQHIAPAGDMELPCTDLAGHPDATAEAARVVRQDAIEPFDLESGPVLRARLVRLAPDEHQLSLVLHHIAIDGWSLPLVCDDLGRLYAATASGEPHRLPEPARAYADYAEWQRAWLQGENLDRLIDYWRSVLGTDPVAPALPADRPRPSTRSFAGAVATAAIDTELARRMRALGRREGATEYMVLLAAFQVLLADWAGDPEITVGTPVAGRGRPGLDRLVGCLINMLPVRTSLADRPDFRALLARVRQAVLGALAHEDLPLDRMVEALVTRRDRQLSPLFRVMFNHVTATPDPDFGPRLRAEGELGWTGETAMFDLGLVVEARGEDLRLTLQYATDLFTEETANTLLARYIRVLDTCTGEPGLPVLPSAGGPHDAAHPTAAEPHDADRRTS
ncbi:amino acid adenylation domain-containing protein [Streptomyces sp. V4I8]|uniref:amino acid adenylation domain-containing protein n=1 Tax=Streptomyces sp. V4I8 TaxID=3156469 RepID=UPI0035156343